LHKVFYWKALRSTNVLFLFSSETTLNAYLYATCRSGEGGEADNHGANDVDNGDYSFTLNEYKRYGVIRGYGYATKKCVCYTNGSGCDCTNQNEGYAIRNLATYGPAVVCLDASTWQDYSGGILTADSGCSSGFMDVNHCVQAVGYAFYGDDDNGREGGGEDNHGGSHDNKNSRDESDSKRNGYWIIKNQWSTYWGMNGYAYVAMGSNTCGILNDMVQVYT
jgi:Papain family cysteine protease